MHRACPSAYDTTFSAPAGAWYKSGVYSLTHAREVLMGRGKDETSPEERRAILEQVLEGMTNGKTVADTARLLKIPAGRIRTWLARDPEIYAEYQRVRPMLGAAFAEEAIRVARESTSQTTAMDRVLIDTLKWAAAKSAPTEYGEKQTVQHEGQQTLQVKVIEDEVPVRNVKALKEAAVTAVLEAAANAPIRALPAPDPDEMA